MAPWHWNRHPVTPDIALAEVLHANRMVAKAAAVPLTGQVTPKELFADGDRRAQDEGHAVDEGPWSAAKG